MGIFKELSTEFKRKTKKAIRVTPYEKKTLKRLKKSYQNPPKKLRDIDFRYAVHGRPKKKKSIDIRKLKKQLKGKKGTKIIIISN